MPTYIIQANWTGKGVQNIKESPTRLDAFKQALQKVGGELKAFYMVRGPFDMLAIVEAPSDEAIASVTLAFEAKGSIRNRPLRAFTENEYRKIIADLP
jgi:uncharacterized protein with GYD domain